MNDLRRKSPREFWKLFKTTNSIVCGEDISVSEFKDYFCNLMSVRRERGSRK
jgi:hypothetical protein